MCEPQSEGHVVECGNCQGKGRNPEFPLTQKCSVCQGVGKVLLK